MNSLPLKFSTPEYLGGSTLPTRRLATPEEKGGTLSYIGGHQSPSSSFAPSYYPPLRPTKDVPPPPEALRFISRHSQASPHRVGVHQLGAKNPDPLRRLFALLYGPHRPLHAGCGGQVGGGEAGRTWLRRGAHSAALLRPPPASAATEPEPPPSAPATASATASAAIFVFTSPAHQSCREAGGGGGGKKGSPLSLQPRATLSTTRRGLKKHESREWLLRQRLREGPTSRNVTSSAKSPRRGGGSYTPDVA